MSKSVRRGFRSKLPSELPKVRQPSGFQSTRPAQSWVYFNNIGVGSFSSWSDTQVVAIVPSGATSGPVYVTINAAISNYANFTVPNNVINSVSPTNRVAAARSVSQTRRNPGTGLEEQCGSNRLRH